MISFFSFFFRDPVYEEVEEDEDDPEDSELDDEEDDEDELPLRFFSTNQKLILLFISDSFSL